jgi:hypothetical protein
MGDPGPGHALNMIKALLLIKAHGGAMGENKGTTAFPWKKNLLLLGRSRRRRDFSSWP